MPRQIRRDVVASAVLKGITQAQIDYVRWSGGDWLWTAPEYLLTTYVARAIASIEGPKWVTVEHSAKGAMEDAGAITRGRIPKKVRPAGRVDIAVWWGDGSPRGVIELKNQVRSFGPLAKDLERINRMLLKNCGESSLQFGCLGFYTSAKTDNRGEAVEKLSTSFKSIRQDASGRVCDLLRTKLYASKIRVEDDSAWAAGCVVVSRKPHV